MKDHGRIFRWMMVTLVTVHYSLFTASAQDEKTVMFNPVEHAVISQTIAPDARGAGMGDVGAATDPDVNSQYWNPAKYPFCISRAGVALNYTMAATTGKRYRPGISGRLLPHRRLFRHLRFYSLFLVGRSDSQRRDDG